MVVARRRADVGSKIPFSVSAVEGIHIQLAKTSMFEVLINHGAN